MGMTEGIENEPRNPHPILGHVCLRRRLAIVSLAASIVSLLVYQGVSTAAPHPLVNHIKMTLRANGDSATDSHVSIRWGHPDFHENEYLPRWDVKRATEDVKEFDISDDASEFEIQTQGGRVTGYSLVIEIDGKLAIICRFNAREGWGTFKDGGTLFENKGLVRTLRSGAVNSYGEGNLRVFFNGKPNAGPIPLS